VRDPSKSGSASRVSSSTPGTGSTERFEVPAEPFTDPMQASLWRRNTFQTHRAPTVPGNRSTAPRDLWDDYWAGLHQPSRRFL